MREEFTPEIKTRILRGFFFFYSFYYMIFTIILLSLYIHDKDLVQINEEDRHITKYFKEFLMISIYELLFYGIGLILSHIFVFSNNKLLKLLFAFFVANKIIYYALATYGVALYFSEAK